MEIVCPHCRRVNRVQASRLAEQPECGACAGALLPGAPVALGDEDFDRFLARNTLPVVVDFWAPWCGPCRTMAPVFEQAARRWSGTAVLAKLDTDEAQRTAGRLGIRSIPTLAVFQGGRELGRMSGALPPAQLDSWLRQFIA